MSPVVLSVAYHSQAALERLAPDLARQSRLPSLWLVVDNSPDSAPLNLMALRQCCSKPAALPVERLIGDEGDGFGAGCNRGFDLLEARGWHGWIWLLNPDTCLPSGEELATLDGELNKLPSRAVVGTAVRDLRGQLEASGGWIDSGLNFRRRKLGRRSHQPLSDQPLSVDWLSGCSLALQPMAHHPCARFDPVFPLYYEDMDLCLRLASAGAPLLWLPKPAVSHQRGEGSQAPGERRQRLSTLSYLRFLQRHRPGRVLLLRTLRLLLTTLLRWPLQPRRSLAVLAALIEAFR
jgi:GT2 family glycosyltransferase